MCGEADKWWMSQSKAELLRPQEVGVAQVWGSSAHHWGPKVGERFQSTGIGHLILTQDCISSSEGQGQWGLLSLCRERGLPILEAQGISLREQ